MFASILVIFFTFQEVTGSCKFGYTGTSCNTHAAVCIVGSKSGCTGNTGDQTKCEALGCCFDTSCYHSNAPPYGIDGYCTAQVADRKECGYNGIEYDECVNTRRCCWYTQDNTFWCFKPDRCSTNPCQNSGVCSNQESNYTCACSGQYSGNNCEIDALATTTAAPTTTTAAVTTTTAANNAQNTVTNNVQNTVANNAQNTMANNAQNTTISGTQQTSTISSNVNSANAQSGSTSSFATHPGFIAGVVAAGLAALAAGIACTVYIVMRKKMKKDEEESENVHVKTTEQTKPSSQNHTTVSSPHGQSDAVNW